MDDKLKAKLEKLKTLAERGVGGEKAGAEKKFQELLKKNGLTEADLLEDQVNYYLFSYVFPYRRQLLQQIMYKVLGPEGGGLYKSKGTRNKLGVYCTAAQKLEIELDFDFYSSLFDEEIDLLLEAFIDKQDIYPKDGPVEYVDSSQMTGDQLERWLKKNAYASGIHKRSRVDLIEGKK